MIKTWFLDFDGTLVEHKSYFSKEDKILPQTIDFFKKVIKEEDYVIITTARPHSHKERIINFLNKNLLKFNEVICGLPSGPRILINDEKTNGTKTAYSFNLKRDKGISIQEFSEL